MDISVLQWILVLGSSVLLLLISPTSKSSKGFFAGASATNKEPGAWLLATSLAMSWIMAKSITNTANLGAKFGLVGALTYAVYYLSFLVAGVVIYRMRTKGGFHSIHHFLNTKFGKWATGLFSVVISIRLFNEVWSNTAVIGSYFGEYGTASFLFAVIVFTALTLGYALKGGLRSSLITDAIQLVLFGVLLSTIIFVFSAGSSDAQSVSWHSEWSLVGGLDLMLVAFIQIFSYPFHDPVLTDRGFVSHPKTTLKSYVLASFLGFSAIFFFGFIGIFARSLGIENDAALHFSQSLGVGMALLMNFIMITSAASTLDSTFTSVAKLVVIDLAKHKRGKVRLGRWAMVGIAVFGSVPLFFSPEVLSATTVSGTMVLGLAPIFILWNVRAPKSSFYASYWIGIFSGLALLFGWVPKAFFIGTGSYAELLAVNMYGTVLGFTGFLVPIVWHRFSISLKRNLRQNDLQALAALIPIPRRQPSLLR